MKVPEAICCCLHLCLGIDMVPSITDVWGYDREFCSSSSSSLTRVTQTEKHKLMKFCKNMGI